MNIITIKIYEYHGIRGYNGILDRVIIGFNSLYISIYYGKRG